MAKMNISYVVEVVDRFSKKANKMSRALDKFTQKAERADTDINVDVDAHTRAAERAIDRVNRKQKSLPRRVWIHFIAETDGFNRKIDTLSDKIRNLSVVSGSMLKGMFQMLLPVAVPILATIAGGIGAIGPIIGTTAGAAMGLASSFGAATAGAVALAPYGITLSKRLKTIADAAAEGSDKYLEYGDSTINAVNALNAFRDANAQLTDDLTDPVYDMFTEYIKAATTALDLIRPTLFNVTEAFTNLGESLRNSLGASDVRGIFEWLETAAPRAIENIGKTIGNFIVGLFNMMKAFDPLAQTMEEGFLRMSESFRDWTASLEGSDKFQAFIDYVRENGPKLLSIFSNIVLGLVGMFEAFAPLSADMLTGFQKMTEKFREWGETLAENEGFKNFIAYVRENTPMVMELIGNLTNFLIKLGEGFAAVGSFLLPLINNLLQFTTWLMDTFPWIGKVVAGFVSFVGALRVIVPAITALIYGFQLIFPVIKLLTGVFLRFITGPIGWLIQGIVLLAMIIIQNWDSISAWTSKTWTAVTLWVLNAWEKVKAYTLVAVVAVYNYVKSKFEQVKATVSAVMSATWSLIKSIWARIVAAVVTKVTEMYVSARNKFQEMKSTVSSLMSAIKETVVNLWQQAVAQAITKVVEMYVSIRQKFSEIVSAVSEKMASVKQRIIDLWNQAQSFLAGIDLFSIGANIIKGLIGGIGSMASAAYDAAKNVASNVKNAVTNMMRIKSPSRVMMDVGADVGAGLVIGISKMESPAERAATKLAEAVSKPLANVGKSFELKGGTVRARTSSVGKQIAESRSNGSYVSNGRSDKQAKQSNAQQEPMQAVINLGGYEARGVIEYITAQQAREQRLARGGA